MSQQNINNTEARIDAEDRENEYLERHEKMIDVEVEKRTEDYFADIENGWLLFIESLDPQEDHHYPVTPDDEFGVNGTKDYRKECDAREFYDNNRKELILHHLKAHNDAEVGFLIRSLFYNNRYLGYSTSQGKRYQRKN
jgi:hypothetical protein